MARIGKKRRYLQPWWVPQRWVVKTRATIPARNFKVGDWIMIYMAPTKKEAQQLADEWRAKMGSPTVVEPGPGHKSRRSP